MSVVVPLVRPSLPHPDTWLPKWQSTTKLSGQFSNFGPLWHEAAAKLTSMTGRIALPCSSGLEAVALGIAATAADTVSYEAFTFEATGVAARRIDRNPTVLRTNMSAVENECVVRTVPFGAHRTFRPEAGQTALVIDAAGAFDGSLADYPADAVVACSFHATKNFPIGEGGCVFLPARWTWAVATVKRAMNFGINPATRDLGWRGYQTNAKLDELRCAMLLAQLDRVDYFRDRSARIRRQSQQLADAIPWAWLPYDPGLAQSLVVVAHASPDEFCETLECSGFAARPVYVPNRHASLLLYDEAHMVALPSDLTDAELQALINVAQVKRGRSPAA